MGGQKYRSPARGGASRPVVETSGGVAHTLSERPATSKRGTLPPSRLRRSLDSWQTRDTSTDCFAPVDSPGPRRRPSSRNGPHSCRVRAAVSVPPPDVEQEPGDGHEQARDRQPGHPTPGLGPVVLRHRDHLRCVSAGGHEERGAEGCVRDRGHVCWFRAKRSGRRVSLWHSTRRATRSPSPLQRWWASTLPGTIVRRPPPHAAAYGDDV